MVIKSGQRGNYAIQRQRDLKGDVIWVHVDTIKAFITDQNERTDAVGQAEKAEALQAQEFVVEAILDTRGFKKDKTREFEIKWQGYSETTWEDEEGFSNPKMLQQFLSKRLKKKKKKTSTSGAVKHQTKRQSYYTEIDLLREDPEGLIQRICRSIGRDQSEVLLLWGSIPCRTFSEAPYNSGRYSPHNDHGQNFRDYTHPERPPCCDKSDCPYRQLAVDHDRFIPAIQTAIRSSFDELQSVRKGTPFFYMFENPRASLRKRPYVAPQYWPGEIAMVLNTVDQCAFKESTKKTTDLFTNMNKYAPEGTTGDGRCHRRCGQGTWTSQRSFKHHQAVAQEPHRKPTKQEVMSIPPMLTKEVLSHALENRSSEKQTIVIDLCCGYRSLQPVVEDLGLTYVGADIVMHQSHPVQKVPFISAGAVPIKTLPELCAEFEGLKTQMHDHEPSEHVRNETQTLMQHLARTIRVDPGVFLSKSIAKCTWRLPRTMNHPIDWQENHHPLVWSLYNHKVPADQYAKNDKAAWKLQKEIYPRQPDRYTIIEGWDSASHEMAQHYQERIRQQDGLVMTDYRQAVRGTSDEIDELLVELRAPTPDFEKISDEAGDVAYGSFVYSLLRSQAKPDAAKKPDPVIATKPHRPIRQKCYCNPKCEPRGSDTAHGSHDCDCRHEYEASIKRRLGTARGP